MSRENRENVEKFLSLVKTEESLARKIVALRETLQTNADLSEKEILAKEVLPLAREYGCDFTVEEFLDYSSSISGELSDDDLLNVCGGLSARGVAVGLLVATGLSFVPTIVSSFASGAGGGVSGSTAPEISISQSYDQNYDQNVQEGDADAQQSYDLEETSTAELDDESDADAGSRTELRAAVDEGSLSIQQDLTEEEQGDVAENDADAGSRTELRAAVDEGSLSIRQDLTDEKQGYVTESDAGSGSIAESTAHTQAAPAAQVGGTAVSQTQAETATKVKFNWGSFDKWEGFVENVYACLAGCDFDLDRVENPNDVLAACKAVFKVTTIKKGRGSLQISGKRCNESERCSSYGVSTDYEKKAKLKTLAIFMDMNARGEKSADIKAKVGQITANAEGVKVEADLLTRVQAIK